VKKPIRGNSHERKVEQLLKEIERATSDNFNRHINGELAREFALVLGNASSAYNDRWRIAVKELIEIIGTAKPARRSGTRKPT
jgi:hypothetical protein